jgi:uncharacterized membrane protein YdfJ with MMPL/SSD domain
VLLLAIGAQGAFGAAPDKKTRENRKNAARQAASKNTSQSGQTAPSPAATQQGAATRSVGGVQVGIDPATGRMQQPTPEEAQQLAKELQAMLSREADELPVIQLPNGTMMVNLEDTFQEVAMATKDKHGKVTLHCVNDAAQAMALLNGTATVAPGTAAYGSGPKLKKTAARDARRAGEKE